jgi:hypothetical protein
MPEISQRHSREGREAAPLMQLFSPTSCSRISGARHVPDFLKLDTRIADHLGYRAEAM